MFTVLCVTGSKTECYSREDPLLENAKFYCCGRKMCLVPSKADISSWKWYTLEALVSTNLPHLRMLFLKMPYALQAMQTTWRRNNARKMQNRADLCINSMNSFWDIHVFSYFWATFAEFFHPLPGPRICLLVAKLPRNEISDFYQYLWS